MLVPLSLLSLLAAAPVVAVLSTGAEAELTELRFQPVGEAPLAPVVARLRHLPGESVQAALLPGTRRVLAVAVTEARRDLSFASSLFLLEAGKEPRLLTDRVALGTRPVVTAEGRVFVQRGASGADGDDALTVDELELGSGRVRPVLSFIGSTAFLAGAVGRELLVYRVSRAGADLVAVHVDSLGVRTLLPSLVPLARDFTFTADRTALLFTQYDPAVDRWYVARLELATRQLRRLAEGPTMALLPTALPDGRVAYAPSAGGGLVDLAGKVVLAPRGAGFERVLAFGRDGAAIGLHERPGDFPLPLGFSAPAQRRLELAGVSP